MYVMLSIKHLHFLKLLCHSQPAPLPTSATHSTLPSIARHLQKHARLMAVLGSMDNGKTIREMRDCDVPIVVRHLYHHAGWAQLADTEMGNWKPLGEEGEGPTAGWRWRIQRWNSGNR